VKKDYAKELAITSTIMKCGNDKMPEALPMQRNIQTKACSDVQNGERF